jgi:hypothetical protein
VGAVDWCGPCVWGIFDAAGRCMLEMLKSFGDVARHGSVDCGVNAIPAQGHGEIEGPGPICCDCVHFF